MRERGTRRRVSKGIGCELFTTRPAAELAPAMPCSRRAGSLYTRAGAGQSAGSPCGLSPRGTRRPTRQVVLRGLLNGGTAAWRRGCWVRHARYPAPSAGATRLTTSR
jgi:hypothetical protein